MHAFKYKCTFIMLLNKEKVDMVFLKFRIVNIYKIAVINKFVTEDDISLKRCQWFL